MMKSEGTVDIKYEDTVPFVFPITEGVVVKVYDGDTITIASKMPYEASPLFRFQVRLEGIDTPELKSKNPKEKAAAKVAKEALQTLLLHKHIQLKEVKNEKFGRILAYVYLDDMNVNEWMISQSYAVAYDGKKKSEWVYNDEEEEVPTEKLSAPASL